METPAGYWLEYRPGSPCLYSPEAFSRETRHEGAQIRGLYLSPQGGCQQSPAAYRGRFWVLAKHFRPGTDPIAQPLYLGPILYEPPIDEVVALVFPSLIEIRLQEAQPWLYGGG